MVSARGIATAVLLIGGAVMASGVIVARYEPRNWPVVPAEVVSYKIVPLSKTQPGEQPAYKHIIGLRYEVGGQTHDLEELHVLPSSTPVEAPPGGTPGATVVHVDSSDPTDARYFEESNPASQTVLLIGQVIASVAGLVLLVDWLRARRRR